MSTEEDLSSVIENSRKVSGDGSLVTYDLTENVDFSDPRRVAEVLATVFFEKDAVHWFSVSGDHIEFNPTYKVRIVLAEDHSKKLEDTVDDFLEDLKKEEIYPKFSDQINDNARRMSRLKTAMAAHSLNSLIFRRFDRNVDKDYLEDDLFVDLLERVEIRSLNNEDLINWKHLPL